MKAPVNDDDFLGNSMIRDSESITFSVQASNDAHIGFMCNSCNDFYEIVIGGWANTKSVIRRKPLGTYDAVAKNSASTSGIVDGNEYRPFWAQALNGIVRFGTGHIIGQNVVIQWQDPSPIIPNNIGFMTGYGSSGDWIVENNLSGIPFLKLLPCIDAHWLAVDSC